jgi:hypothetical protein
MGLVYQVEFSFKNLASDMYLIELIRFTTMGDRRSWRLLSALMQAWTNSTGKKP